MEFRFCGKQFLQDLETLEAEITCKATTGKLEHITIVDRDNWISEHRAEDVPALYTEQQDAQSVVGSLSYNVRTCRLGQCCATNQLQSVVLKPTIADLSLCNKTVDLVRRTSGKGIKFCAGSIGTTA